MKQIETVVCPIEHACRYDEDVNNLLADGWVLNKRSILFMTGDINEAYNSAVVQALYAELERYVPPFPEEITL